MKFRPLHDRVLIKVLDSEEKIRKFIETSENMFESTKLVLEKKWKDFIELLNKKNISRKECLLLPMRTVLKALKL